MPVRFALNVEPMQYKVIEGQEGVSFPFPDNHITLSETTSQEDLKTVFEHPLGHGYVQLVSEPQTLVVEEATEAEPLMRVRQQIVHTFLNLQAFPIPF